MALPVPELPLQRRDAHRRNLLALWAAALIGATAAVRAIADEGSSRLEQLVAGYVLNFAKFVEWPEESRTRDLVICVAGNKGLYEALRTGADTSTIGSRHIAVRMIEDAPATAGCHILYLQPAGRIRFAQVEASAPTLTVSDSSGFARAGGTIELFTQQNRLRFIINLDSARRAGLRISSSLLQLAAAVEGEAR